MQKEIIGNCELYLGDCYDILPTLGKMDAIITDPPYGINLDTDFSKMKSKFTGKNGNKYEKIQGDNKPFDPTFLFDKSNQFALFGADYYFKKLIRGGGWQKGLLFVLDKRLNELSDKMFGSCFEIIWFYPARKRDIMRHKWAGFFGIEKEDIKQRIHPTQKPIGLMKKIILNFKNNPVIICDPFMGSGSTGVAAVELDRRFIGIEIDEKYFEIACERIATAAAQGRFNFK
jgi:site-specific DNA-methyltransferase (adenine-specific)/modification methylase